MIRFLILYSRPNDVPAFERHYQHVHLPLARKLPGLQRYTVSRNIMPANGSEPYYLVAELDWVDMASLQAAFGSAEGQATAEDVAAHLAPLSQGVRSMIYEVEEM